MRPEILNTILGVQQKLDRYSWTTRFANPGISSKLMTSASSQMALVNYARGQVKMNVLLGTNGAAGRIRHRSLIDAIAHDHKHLGTMTAVTGLSRLMTKANMADIFHGGTMARILQTNSAMAIAMANISGRSHYASRDLHQMTGIRDMYTKMSAMMAVDASVRDEEEGLEVIEELATRVADAATDIYERGYITQEDLALIRTNILQYIRNLSRADWQWIIEFLVVVFFGMLSHMDAVQPDAQAVDQHYATREDIEQFKNELIESSQGIIGSNGITKRISTDLKLRAKPGNKAYCIKTIPRATTVTVLNVENDWAYITYVDAVDSLPSCGWISTRYFMKAPLSKSMMSRAKRNKVRN